MQSIHYSVSKCGFRMLHSFLILMLDAYSLTSTASYAFSHHLIKRNSKQRIYVF